MIYTGLVEKLGLLDRIQPYCSKTSHFLLTDHEPDFLSDSVVRLICPTKSDLGRITTQSIDRIIPKVLLAKG